MPASPRNNLTYPAWWQTLLVYEGRHMVILTYEFVYYILYNHLCSTCGNSRHIISHFPGMNSIQLVADVCLVLQFSLLWLLQTYISLLWSLKFRSNEAIVWHLWPLSKHNKVHNVFAKSSSKRLLLLRSVSIQVRIISGSYMTVYLGKFGLSLNIPFNILLSF